MPRRGVKAFARLGVADAALSVVRWSPAGRWPVAAGSAGRWPCAARAWLGTVGWRGPAGAAWGASSAARRPILFQRLECPDPDAMRHAAPGDSRGFDGLE